MFICGHYHHQSKLNAITDSFPDVNNPGPNQWFDVWLFLNQVLDELRVHKHKQIFWILNSRKIKLEELYRSIPNRQAWPFSSRHKHFDVCGFKNKNLNLSITLVNTTTGQHCRWPSLALCFNSVKALIKYSGVPLGSILGPFGFFFPFFMYAVTYRERAAMIECGVKI